MRPGHRRPYFWTNERLARFRELAARDHPADAIAAELNCTESALRGCASKFGIAWRPRRGTATRDVTVPMTSVTRRALLEAARCRGVTTSELAARIVRTVAGQGLVAAVLDDGCESPSPPPSPSASASPSRSASPSASRPPSRSASRSPSLSRSPAAGAAEFMRTLNAEGGNTLEALRAAAALEGNR
jgi:hypothetical protein